ncbi:MAG: 16S rRNA (cytidine(1402)-2'-O)-methyltransferase [Bacteroidota bacterium]|jgi:16S rRNA (cytidine1402-2'-O)-methyltransferase
MAGKLIIIPTPLGNLEDITLRAIRMLKEVDLLLAEDTRHTLKLLQHLYIDKQMQSFHQHNEHRELQRIVNLLHSGKNIGLVSDAGTPGISDPGFLIVRECLRNDIEVECLPGPTAFVPALIKSGLPCDAFVFEGFLPEKKGRQTKIKELAAESRTIVLYEAPHRLIKTLKQLTEFFGEDRLVSVSRELTKKFEQTINASLKDAVKYFESQPPKGEIVITIAGKKD